MNWTTTDELNVSHFDVQRSVNSKDFNTIASVQATGIGDKQENYTFLDQSPPPQKGVLYYRLEIVDRDGSKTYSEIREVQLSNNLQGIKIYPNPAHGFVTIETNKTKQLTIINSLEQILVDQAVNLPITKIALSKFDRGIYYVKTLGEDGGVNIFPLLVE